MERLAEFVHAHGNDDTTRLILDRGKWPDIDMDMAVACIESRRKLRGKVQEWYDEARLIFPYKLSAEQCSSSATARYKAGLAAGIASIENQSGVPPLNPSPGAESTFKIADLTGGLGVDSWFFSKVASEVLYNEMQPKLCEAAIRNFRILDAGNINCTCAKAEQGKLTDILNGFSPDIIYMDPARRGEGGRKVFLIEDCTPDVLTLKDEIFTFCRHIMLKLSPMADISMVCNRLGHTCREVHVVAAGGECKELLIWMDREWNDEYTITAVELPPEPHPALSLRHSAPDVIPPRPFTFTPSEEKSASCTLGTEGRYLFEPGKALMKSGAFNLISSRLKINKLGHSTHYYLIDDESMVNELLDYGKVFHILSSSGLDKRSIKEAARSCPKAEVTARNIPMNTEVLRKKLGTAPSDSFHIFALRSDLKGPILLTTERIKDKTIPF